MPDVGQPSEMSDVDFQALNAAWKAKWISLGEWLAREVGPSKVNSINMPPEYLFPSEGWVAYNPYHPGTIINPSGYQTTNNSDPIVQSALRRFIWLKNEGGAAVNFSVFMPQEWQVVSVPAGQTIKTGPFITYAARSGSVEFKSDTVSGVSVRVTAEVAAGGVQVQGAPLPFTLTPN